jgi:hypothetical protein
VVDGVARAMGVRNFCGVTVLRRFLRYKRRGDGNELLLAKTVKRRCSLVVRRCDVTATAVWTS